MTTTYTGETKTVSIPDTAAITSRGGGKDAQATTLAVADLKAGDVVQIWFADDGTTVSKVSVMNMPTAATKAN
ncbi:MAG: hypothetical protein HGA22_11040 [Clostridiales bacterium]|nr:hypothetical protein [Clostridiales bacterium]